MYFAIITIIAMIKVSNWALFIMCYFVILFFFLGFEWCNGWSPFGNLCFICFWVSYLKGGRRELVVEFIISSFLDGVFEYSVFHSPEWLDFYVKWTFFINNRKLWETILPQDVRNEEQFRIIVVNFMELRLSYERIVNSMGRRDPYTLYACQFPH